MSELTIIRHCAECCHSDVCRMEREIQPFADRIRGRRGYSEYKVLIQRIAEDVASSCPQYSETGEKPPFRPD